jgi:hypothetical protein
MKPSPNRHQIESSNFLFFYINYLDGARGRNRTGTASRWCSIVQCVFTVLLDLSDSGY